jgi:hypothetical protein
MTRAMHEIQAEAMRLVTVQISGAVEACEWASVFRLAERLQELAQRGLYHASLERAKTIGATMPPPREPDPR